MANAAWLTDGLSGTPLDGSLVKAAALLPVPVLEVLSHTPLSKHPIKVLASARPASMASSDMLKTRLDFSRMEAGVIKRHAAAFDLQTLLNKIENALAPQADSKDLHYRTRETTLTIDSDAALVR